MEALEFLINDQNGPKRRSLKINGIYDKILPTHYFNVIQKNQEAADSSYLYKLPSEYSHKANEQKFETFLEERTKKGLPMTQKSLAMIFPLETFKIVGYSAIFKTGLLLLCQMIEGILGWLVDKEAITDRGSAKHNRGMLYLLSMLFLSILMVVVGTRMTDDFELVGLKLSSCLMVSFIVFHQSPWI